MKTEPVLAFELESTAHAVDTASRRLEDFCHGAGVAGELRFQLTLCIAEALNNAVEHAYGFSPKGRIALHCTIEQNTFIARIRDQGLAMHAPPDPTLPAAYRAGGRGWSIIHEWMDEAHYVRSADGNHTLLMRKLN